MLQNEIANKTCVKSEQRDNSLDVARGIAIILVVMGHIWTGGLFHEWIYSFHMPLFFIITGLVGNWRCARFQDLVEKIWKNVKRYVVPYFLMMMFAGEASINNIIKYAFASRIVLGDYPLIAKWFLPCLFVASSYVITIIFLIERMLLDETKNKAGFLITSVVLFIGGQIFDGVRCGNNNPWMWNVAIMGAFFIMLGMLMKKGWWIIGTIPLSQISVWGGVSAFLSLFFFRKVVPNDFGMTMVAGDYGDPFYFLVAALSGSFFILFIGNILKDISFLKFIGKNSLTIMIFHGLFLKDALFHVESHGKWCEFAFVMTGCIAVIILKSLFESNSDLNLGNLVKRHKEKSIK